METADGFESHYTKCSVAPEAPQQRTSPGGVALAGRLVIVMARLPSRLSIVHVLATVRARARSSAHAVVNKCVCSCGRVFITLFLYKKKKPIFDLDFNIFSYRWNVGFRIRFLSCFWAQRNIEITIPPSSFGNSWWIRITLYYSVAPEAPGHNGTWDMGHGTRNGTRDGTCQKVAFIRDGFHRELVVWLCLPPPHTPLWIPQNLGHAIFGTDFHHMCFGVLRRLRRQTVLV